MEASDTRPPKHSYADRLVLASRLTEPAIRSAIEAFAPAAGSRGLDACCGVGLHVCWLAERTGPAGRVVGLDASGDHLMRARRLAADEPVRDRVEFVQGDLRHLPFEAGSFDWAWCADALYPFGGMDPVAGLAELRRVVRPGGTVALVFWSNQSLLAGHPELEARLNLAHVGWNPSLAGVAPELHYMRALGWMNRAGLAEPRAQSFVTGVQAPVKPALRESLAFVYEMFWGDLGDRLSTNDRRALEHLCNPASTGFLPDTSGYCCQVTYTLFTGRVPPA